MNLRPIFIWEREKIVFTQGLSKSTNDYYKELSLRLDREYEWTLQGVYHSYQNYHLAIF